MKRILLVLVLAAACGPALAQQDISRVNGGITARAGETYGELDTVNGGIRIQAGATVREADTVNGGIEVEDEARVGKLDTVNGGIRIGERVDADDDVGTVNGSIRIGRGSRVAGAVSTVNGGISMESAEIGRGIETVNGDITVGAGSVVRGGLTVRKPKVGWFGGSFSNSRDPRIVIGPGATVEGDLVFERDVELFVHETARIGKVTGATPKAFSGDRP